MRSDKTSPKIPQRVFYGQGNSMLIGALIGLAENGAVAESNPDKSMRRVMGFLIPTWQRKPEWTMEQNEQFIQSIYEGLYIGAFIYNDSIGSAPMLNGILVDGQQRLLAIENYIAGNVAVPGRDGKKYRWTELSDKDRAHFTRMTIGFEVIRMTDEAELIRLYNLFNYGGTPHKESQRAVL